MTYLQQLRGFGVPTLLVDGGNVFYRTLTKKAPDRGKELTLWNHARVILNAYNLLGYQAVAVGPEDLQLGLNRLQELANKAHFPFVCANLVDKKTKQPYFEPYTIVNVNGLRVGVYGMLQQRLNPTIRERAIPDGEILPPIETTKRIVAEMKAKCDAIIGLSHLHEETNSKILEEVPEITALVDPASRHGFKTVWIHSEEDYSRDFGGRPRLRIDGQGSRIGIADLTVSKSSKKPSSYTGYHVPIEPHIMRHPVMTELLTFVRAGRDYPLDRKRDAHSMYPFDDALGAATCGSCHPEQLEFWKSTSHASNFHTLEATGDQANSDCVGCHSLGYGVTFVNAADAKNFKEVQCENCHGIVRGHAEDPEKHRFGEVGERTCVGCHNKDYTQKDFDYEDARPRASCPTSAK